MKVIENKRLDAINWLESDKAAGITFYLGHDKKIAIIQGKYIHAETLTNLVEKLKCVTPP